MAQDYVIQTDGLTKRYGSLVAVDNLTLRVPRGEVFGLLGPNGSGKTTTIGMLLGLVRPSSGTRRLFGLESDGVTPETLRRVGAIVETPTFYPYLSGRANLKYFEGISRRGSRDEVDRLLELVGLTGRAGSKFRTYSLGMKQRLGLAYALLGDPELLFLDEPTNGMDPAGMAEVRGTNKQAGRRGTHHPSFQPPFVMRSSRYVTAWLSFPTDGSSNRAPFRSCWSSGARYASGPPMTPGQRTSSLVCNG